MHNSHVRDAAALCTYLSWLEEQVAAGHTVTEVSGAAKLDALRSVQTGGAGVATSGDYQGLGLNCFVFLLQNICHLVVS